MNPDLPAMLERTLERGPASVLTNGTLLPDRALDPIVRAAKAAQRDAVEQASGVFITSETEMRNFDLISDEVLSRSKGFIRSYKVLKEERDGPFDNVTIQAMVVRKAFMDDVSESLENLYQRVGKPRVMLVVEEFDAADSSIEVSFYPSGIKALATGTEGPAARGAGVEDAA